MSKKKSKKNNSNERDISQQQTQQDNDNKNKQLLGKPASGNVEKKRNYKGKTTRRMNYQNSYYGGGYYRGGYNNGGVYSDIDIVPKKLSMILPKIVARFNRH